MIFVFVIIFRFVLTLSPYGIVQHCNQSLAKLFRIHDDLSMPTSIAIEELFEPQVSYLFQFFLNVN